MMRNENRRQKTKGVFVTGSGTGVGKTHAAAWLLWGFGQLGLKTVYMKPVETGCEPSSDNTALIGADTEYAYKFIEHRADIEQCSPYRFKPACSPHLAARLAGDVIDIDRVVLTYRELCEEASADIALVEGAGGVMVPISDDKYMADMISALGIPAVFVAEPGLGTLNHTFLSLRELERRKISVIGTVINNARGIKRDFIFEDNVEMIKKYVDPAPCLIINYHDGGVSVKETTKEFCNAVIARI